MKPEITNYITEVNNQYITGKATEHSYRPALQKLLSSLLPKYTITNEPSRMDCGVPDIRIANNNIPIAYIECKDINDSDLDGQDQNKNKSQFDRYKNALDHIIFTDYLDFHYYEHGKFVDSVRVGEIKGGKVAPVGNNEALFLQIIGRLAKATPQKITSSKQLAILMANKARLMANIIEKTLANNVNNTTELSNHYKTFKTVLIHDLTQKSFADIFSQTICYGMFAARLQDTTPDDFSRMEAAGLIPTTNPFLRNLFQSIATFNLDNRIAWIVDDLAEAFRVTDMPTIMADFGSNTQQTDPILHFYEEFLLEYDHKTKIEKGVYYTPQSVVEFIVRAVDDILKDKFDISNGLADNSKVRLDRAIEGTTNKKSKDNKVHRLVEYHKVQILDPATGTGTFPAQVIKQVYENLDANGMSGIWSDYVKEHLIPRLNAFEFMMSPYAIAHIKLNMVLNQIGGQNTTNGINKRLNVFLTNSLENYNNTIGTLFGQWLSTEAQEADRVKRDTPVMIMLGNPPYKGISENKSKWITDLIKDYKKEPNSNAPLKEKKNWLNDDYVKFIRLGQFFVDKNNEGIMAYINNNHFLDNVTFRGMRWSLLKSFDEIYIVNLHGEMDEKTPNGSRDENVFDITKGTSINIFIKNGKRKENDIATVNYVDVYGSRNDKYKLLGSYRLANLNFQTLTPEAPYYFFVPRNTSNKNVYYQGFKINELMRVYNSGIVSMGDGFAIANDANEIKDRITDFLHTNYTPIELNKKYALGKNYPDFILQNKNNGFRMDGNKIVPISYRPFDEKYTYYDRQILWRPRDGVMQHIINKLDNFALLSCRQIAVNDWCHVFVANHIVDDSCVSNRSKERSYVFPLYLYDTSNPMLSGQKTPNLNPTIWNKINTTVGGQTAPEQVFDYIYGVLHSPKYRTAFKEFLKVDFPHIPYPSDKAEFDRISTIGTQLRELHLMTSVPSMPNIAQYKISGSDEVVKVEYKNKNVYINSTQCFENVPETAWNFYIGGHQPAQKWLKDRKKSTLSFNDILHYRNIIAILIETDRLMNTL